MRIGELLVSRGLVKRRDVDEALEAQVVVGGRVGTHLVERRVIGLDVLAEALGEQHELPAAKKSHFERADAAVKARLSPRLAGLLRAVPLGVLGEEGAIAVAVMDPLAPEGLETLAAALGADIVQAVAPELRIHYELERAFGLRRPNRFLRVPRRDEPARKVERRRYVSTLSAESGAEAIAKVALRRVAVPAVQGAGESGDIGSFSEALREIRRARGREGVADAALAAIRRGLAEAVDAALIFVVREGVAFGWKGLCRPRSETEALDLEDVAVPLAEASILSASLERGASVGPAPAEPTAIDLQLWSLFGRAPACVAALPVEVGGRIACLLYVHSEAPESYDAEARDRLMELAQAMSSAFDFLIRAAER